MEGLIKRFSFILIDGWIINDEDSINTMLYLFCFWYNDYFYEGAYLSEFNRILIVYIDNSII